MKKLKLLAFVAALSLAANAARAQDSALLDLLVKKGVISQQEAEQTSSELAQQYASTPAGKLNLSTPIQQIRLYGDARLRYEYREGAAQEPAGSKASEDTANADRLRYRLRLGADVTLTDDWFLGIRLETSNDGRSTNVTESNAGTGAATGGAAGAVAPFGKAGTTTGSFITSVTPTTAVVGGKTVVTGFTTKTSAAVTKVDFGSTIFVGQLYLRYKVASWLTVEGGKMPNPFITTPMVWDADINPEGFAEQFKYTVGPFGGSTTAGYDKDSKSSKDLSSPGALGDITIDLFANLGQFIYDTASPQDQYTSSTSSPSGKNDTWLLGWQIGARVNLPKSVYIQAAPTFYNYTGDKGNDFNGNYSGDPGGNQTSINDLAIVDVPAEIGWKSFGLPFRVFGDISDNVDANSRATNAGHPGHNDGLSWQAGISINQLKKKGDWNLAAYWQYSGAYALDPNLVDNDIFDSHQNMQGLVFQGGYALTDAVTINLQYNYGQIIDKSLGTGGSDGTLDGATASPALRNYSLVQVDLNVKF